MEVVDLEILGSLSLRLVVEFSLLFFFLVHFYLLFCLLIFIRLQISFYSPSSSSLSSSFLSFTLSYYYFDTPFSFDFVFFYLPSYFPLYLTILAILFAFPPLSSHISRGRLHCRERVFNDGVDSGADQERQVWMGCEGRGEGGRGGDVMVMDIWAPTGNVSINRKLCRFPVVVRSKAKV
jgi:hypothetical protein